MWLDSNLSMGDHITKTSSAAFYYLYNIRRIRKNLSKECTTTLIHAFISSRLDYCNNLLYGLPAYQIQKLRRVQNSAARLVLDESKFCHITPFLRVLHWLPVKYRIVFKAIHKLAPTYISELVSLKDTGGRYYLRSNTPNANMADRSVVARHESHESEASQSSMFCCDNVSPEKSCSVVDLVCFCLALPILFCVPECHQKEVKSSEAVFT